MEKTYVHTPENFNDIEMFVICDSGFIQTCLLDDSKIYLYDTCSFRNHSNLDDPELLFDLIKQNDGVVLLPRIVIMELASKSKTLNAEYVEYIKNIYGAGIKVCLLEEEDIFDVMSICFASNRVINEQLSWAVKAVKSRTDTISEALEEDKALMQDVILKPSSKNNVFKRFFSAVRNKKTQGDNLGEELITICVHILSNLPGCGEYKYIVLTDDKGAVTIINKALANIQRHYGIRPFSVMTSPALAQMLFDTGLLAEKDKLTEFLTACAADGKVGFCGSEQYDLVPEFKSMCSSDLASLISDPGKVHINY